MTHPAADSVVGGQAQPGAMAAAQQQAAASAGPNAAPPQEQVDSDAVAAVAEPNGAYAAAAAQAMPDDAYTVAADAQAGHAEAVPAAAELGRVDEAHMLRNPPMMHRYQALVSQMPGGYINVFPDTEEEDGWECGGLLATPGRKGKSGKRQRVSSG